MTRCFIAIELPAEIKKELTNLIEELDKTGIHAKWLTPETMHITLKFLGNITDEQIGAVTGSVNKLASGIKPFDISIEGIGVFSSRKRPQVIWAGIEKGKEQLVSIIGTLNEERSALSEAERPLNMKKIMPHVTLGRIRDYRKNSNIFREKISGIQGTEESFTVSEIVLFSSILTPEGAIHRPIWKVKFGSVSE